ncbi:uncharacterized protein LOC141911540 [Tubulanus polymorphus]|uniref:uncharacterized protein LOC141911540 n=1 Tax=Tubulanus polymorphus TaxID=672921 RepID=UPI003DA5862E
MRCQKCNGRHHVTICEFGSKKESSNGEQSSPRENQTPSPDQSAGEKAISGVCLSATSSRKVLLQTAQAIMQGDDGPVKVRILFDTGSQKSYITKRLADRLHLQVLGNHRMNIQVFGSDTDGQFEEYPIVESRLLDTNGTAMTFPLVVIPVICTGLSVCDLSNCKKMFPHLRGVHFSEFYYKDGSVDVDILIGADFYWSVMTGEVRRSNRGPVALGTKFGWTLSGPIGESETNQSSMVYFINEKTAKKSTYSNHDDDKHNNLLITQQRNCDCHQLETKLKNFWSIENLGLEENTDDPLFEEFKKSVQFKDGRYHVKLPWRDVDDLILPDNYEHAKKRLINLLTRLRRSPDILSEYDSVIKEQLDNNIVQLVESPEIGEVGKVHYIPHHAVIRSGHSTTKLRIVYDASCKADGPSLNELLHAGPVMTNNILHILLRLRMKPVALTGDIEKAFLQIMVDEDDTDVLRFLWVKDTHDENSDVIVLKFKRVVFGVTSSPYLLNATLKFHMESHEDQKFAEKFLQSAYVDDTSSSFDTVGESFEFYRETKSYLKKAGFNWRKIHTNSVQLRDLILQQEADSSNTTNGSHVDESYAQQTLGMNARVQESDMIKILGVCWNYSTDEIMFDLTDIINYIQDLTPTKRNIVGVAARFFDPLGVIAPAVLKFKLLFQDTCRSEIGWDEIVDADLERQWKQIVEDMKNFETIHLTRCYSAGLNGGIDSFELHGFCDASCKAYGAMIYLVARSEDQSNSSFVASKTKVAPTKQVSIPRLELLSAVTLAKLMKVVYDELSSVALAWIKGVTKDWKRVIRKLIKPEAWRHCAGIKNPADIPSRGIRFSELMSDKMLLTGPDWLLKKSLPSKIEKIDDALPEECLVEMKIAQRNLISSTSMMCLEVGTVSEREIVIEEIIDCKKYSSFTKLVMVTSAVMKAFKVWRRKTRDWELSINDLNDAEKLWLTVVQKCLKIHRLYNVWRLQLKLFEEDGIIKSAGKLQNSTLKSSQKNPIVLVNHHVTEIIIWDAHERVMHQKVKATLGEVRSRFWIIRERQIVKKLIAKCYLCKKLDALPYKLPLPPPLPEFRVTRSHPFETTGVDFAGPMYVKGRKKIWICLFTCTTSKAVHLELVLELTTDGFLRCLRRYAARRGMPRKMISDNAKTYRKTSTELAKFLSDPRLKEFALRNRIEWMFILEKAPWWGGFYERLVKSAKRCLKKILRVTKLSIEEYNTVLTEVELVLNCRPLSYIASDDFDEPVTPSHLVYGRRLMGTPDTHPCSEEYVPEMDRKAMSGRMRHLKTLMDHFWQRWSSEYLLELRESHRQQNKENSDRRKVKIGEIVLVHDEGKQRGEWRLGKITELITGSDDNPRGAFLKLGVRDKKSTTLRRPLNLLYPLEVQDSPELTRDAQAENVRRPIGLDVVTRPSEVVCQSRPKRKSKENAEKRLSGWINELELSDDC